MTNNPKKHIIDAFLREIYGEKSPPDQSEEIMRRLQEKDQTLVSDSKLGLGLEPESDSGLIPVVTIKTEKAPRSSTNWIVIAATFLFCAGLLGAIFKIAQNQNQIGNDVANIDKRIKQASDASRSTKPFPTKDSKGDLKKDSSEKKASDSRLAKSNPSSPGGSPKVTPATPSKGLPPHQIAKALPVGPFPFATTAAAVELGELVTEINSSFRENWRINVIAVQDPVSGEVWLNRLFESLLGRKPSELDIARLSPDLEDSEGRRRIVEKLVSYKDYSHEFSDYWAEKFLRHLVNISRSNQGSSEPQDRTKHLALRQFLRESFQKQKPLDELAKELITATGSIDPQATSFQPASEFVAIHGKSSERLTSQISRVFLGTETQCARCHTDSLYSQERGDFLGLEAFLKGVQIQRQTGVAEVVEVRQNRQNPGQFYHDKNGVSVYAPPMVAGRETPLNLADPRTDLATAIVQSDRFAMTMVDWVWREIYGYGLSREGRIKDSTNAPHHQLLTKLGEQLVARKFDFRSVVRWAVLTDTFAVSDEPAKDTLAKDIPKFGGIPFFSYAYDKTAHDSKMALAKLVEAYQAPDGLSVVGRLQLSPRTSGSLELGALNPLEKGPLPIDMEIPDFAKGWGVESSLVTILDQISASQNLDFAQKLEHVFMLGLKRKPSNSERSQSQLLLKTAGSSDAISEKQVLQDIWWAIYRR